MEKHHIASYDERTGTGLIRHVLIRYGFATGEIMVCFVINGTSIPNAGDLIKSLTAVPRMTAITVSVNTRRTNVIMGESFEVLWGQGYITDYIGKIRYQISPLSFYQVNPVQTEKLYSLALEYADLKGGETVWDLYCGIGTISLFLAQKAGQVYGVRSYRRQSRMHGETPGLTGLKMQSSLWERRRKFCRLIMKDMRKNTAGSRPVQM